MKYHNKNDKIPEGFVEGTRKQILNILKRSK